MRELTNSMYETWLDVQDLVHSIQNLSAKMEQIDSWLKMEEEPERSWGVQSTTYNQGPQRGYHDQWFDYDWEREGL